MEAKRMLFKPGSNATGINLISFGSTSGKNYEFIISYLFRERPQNDEVLYVCWMHFEEFLSHEMINYVIIIKEGRMNYEQEQYIPSF